MEQWIEIKDFPNYEVSNLGVVRNKTTKQVKRFSDNGRGYLRGTFYKNNKGTTLYLHRILAIAFLENPNNYPEVNHKDGDKTNNSLENLEWCSSQDNQMHKMYVLKHGNCKTVECVETGATYPSTMEAERATNCDHRHISECCRGIRTICGGYHWRYVE